MPILYWNRLVSVFQTLFLRFWDFDLFLGKFLPQLLCSLLSEGSMMWESFVAQLNRVQGRVMFIDALKVRVTDVGRGRLGDLKRHRYPDVIHFVNVMYIERFSMTTPQSITCEVFVGEPSILPGHDVEAGYFHGGDEEQRPLEPNSHCLRRLRQ